MKSFVLPLLAGAALAGCADYGTVGYGPYGYQAYPSMGYDYAYGQYAPGWWGGDRYHHRDWDGNRDGQAWSGAGAGAAASMGAPTAPGTIGTINAQVAPAPSR